MLLAEDDLEQYLSIFNLFIYKVAICFVRKISELKTDIWESIASPFAWRIIHTRGYLILFYTWITEQLFLDWWNGIS